MKKTPKAIAVAPKKRKVEEQRQRAPWPTGTELQFFVGGVMPVAKGSMRAFIPKGWDRAVVTDSATGLRGYESAVRNAARGELDRRGLPCALRQPFEVHLVFFFPRPDSDFDRHGHLVASARATPWVKPDLDKLLRAALDSLSKHVWDDDSRVVRAVIEKRFSDAARDIGTWIRVRLLPATLRELHAMQQRALPLQQGGPTP